MKFGSPPGIRKFDIRFKDAVKLGYNTMAESEIVAPFQDYRMVSAFVYKEGTFGLTMASIEDVDRANTIFPGGDPPAWKPIATGAIVQVYYKPIVYHHYVFNPTIAAICCDVEVYGWRRGFWDANNTMEDLYFKSFQMNTQDIVTTRILNVGKNTYSVASNVAPGIHQDPTVVNPGDITATNWAKKGAMENIFNIQRMRMRQLKLLSKRKCVTIPAGGIFHFKVMMRMQQGYPPNYVVSSEWGECTNVDRLVVIKWHTQMGTVDSELQQSHLSEKVHIVLGRRASVRGTMVQRVPNLKVQVVKLHDSGQNYVSTQVAEHLILNEVTKTAQQIEKSN